MKTAGTNSRKKAQKAQKAGSRQDTAGDQATARRVRKPWPLAVTKESLRLQPRYGATSLGLDVNLPTNAQRMGGGTCSPRLTESRLYTAGRALRA